MLELVDLMQSRCVSNKKQKLIDDWGIATFLKPEVLFKGTMLEGSKLTPAGNMKRKAVDSEDDDHRDSKKAKIEEPNR